MEILRFIAGSVGFFIVYCLIYVLFVKKKYEPFDPTLLALEIKKMNEYMRKYNNDEMTYDEVMEEAKKFKQLKNIKITKK